MIFSKYLLSGSMRAVPVAVQCARTSTASISRVRSTTTLSLRLAPVATGGCTACSAGRSACRKHARRILLQPCPTPRAVAPFDVSQELTALHPADIPQDERSRLLDGGEGQR